MRNPDNVLNSLKSHANDKGYCYRRLYRNLFNQDFNSWLHHFKYVMEYSMYKTFATKYRTKKRNIIEKYRVGKGFGVTFTTATGQQRTRLFYDEGFARKPPSTKPDIDGMPSKGIFWTRNPLAERLKAQICEWCGATGIPIEIHHIRKLKNLSGKNEWERKLYHSQHNSDRCGTNCIFPVRIKGKFPPTSIA